MLETNNDSKVEENAQNSSLDGNVVPSTSTGNTNQPQINSGKFYCIISIFHVVSNDYIKYFLD